MNRIKGIDVSFYQQKIDFVKVKESGIDFVIIRAGYGRFENQVDPCFEENYKNAKAAGLDTGAYWYSYAKTEYEALQEAQTFLKVIKGKQFEYPLYYDLEGESLSVGKAMCIKMCKAFCNELEKNDCFAGIYMSLNPAENLLNSETRNRYALWLADYEDSLDYSGRYGMWQYTGSGTVNGINVNVDCNYCYENYPEIIKNAGKNGFSAEKILDETGYKLGDKTIGVLSFKELLLIAIKLKIISGDVDKNEIFGNGTEKCVNQLLKKWSYTQNGIAGKKLIMRLEDEISKKL